MRLLLIVLLMMSPAALSAADMGRPGAPARQASAGYCPSGDGSFIATLGPIDAMRRQTTALYEEALANFTDRRVQASRASRHLWADLARITCGIAIGHLDGGEVEVSRLNACECNVVRMRRF
jgi:hypothetical protein